MASENNPKSRDRELVVQDLSDEVLIYDLIIDKAYTLNEMSAAIWRLCDGTNSVSEIGKQLSGRFKQPVTDELVYIALDQFKEDNLLADNEAFRIEFNGLSRRQVIRKVGLASMVALPVIAGLVAPTAANAASGAAAAARQDNGTTCTAQTPVSAECKSGQCVETVASTYNPATGGNSQVQGGLKCCVNVSNNTTGSYTSSSSASGNCNFSTLCCTARGMETLDAARNVYYCTCDATS